MDQASRTAIEGNVAPLLQGWGAIILFALAVAAVTVLVVRVISMYREGTRIRSGSGTAASTTGSSSSTWPVSSEPKEVSPAAIVGSDYYVPTSEEFKDTIKVNILDRQKRDALQLSRELVSEYRRLVESGEAKAIHCVIANPLAKDSTVMRLCEEILKQRGWSGSLFRSEDNTVFFGPANSSHSCSFTADDLNSISDSASVSALIESNIIAPRKALALTIAKQLVDAYQLKLETEKQTSSGIRITLPEKIDHNVYSEVEAILAPRGWSIYHDKNNKYTVYPEMPRDRPYRGGLII